MYPLGGASPRKKFWGAKFFPNHLGSGGVVQNFSGSSPWKEVPKTGFKILGAPQKKFAWGSKLGQISWFYDFFAHFSQTVRYINNLITDFRSTDIPLPDAKKIRILQSTVNYVIESRIYPPSDLIAGLYTKDSPGGTVGGGSPIRRSSVEIISSLIKEFQSLNEPSGLTKIWPTSLLLQVIGFLSFLHSLWPKIVQWTQYNMHELPSFLLALFR